MAMTATHRSADVTSTSSWAKMPAPASVLREVGPRLDHRNVMLGWRIRSRHEVSPVIVAAAGAPRGFVIRCADEPRLALDGEDNAEVCCDKLGLRLGALTMRSEVSTI
jgi:hypothetical protein